MSTTTHRAAGAHAAYDALAPAYDALTAGYPYDRWLEALEHLALEHGLPGRRVLDIACGTGKSFLPLRARGYDVVACDISTEMLRQARVKAPEVRLYQADMRALPAFGTFDLVTCLDDALNYLVSETELEAALRGVAHNLERDGVAIWDLNTLAQYHDQFARDQIVARHGMFIGWRGAAVNAETLPGEVVEVVIDVFTRADEEQWHRTSSIHRQRHWTRQVIKRVSNRAGLELIDIRGQRRGAVIDSDLDERVHTKAIYLARRG